MVGLVIAAGDGELFGEGKQPALSLSSDLDRFGGSLGEFVFTDLLDLQHVWIVAADF